MRRPPDKDAQSALSDRDVESSNATLNTLFGGSRQKSWMMGAGTPVRPTPRTSISKAPEPPATLAQKKVATVLPSPAPSDEPSPILANSPMNGAQNEKRRDIHNNDGRRPPTTTINNTHQTRQPSTSEADIGTSSWHLSSEALSRPSSSSSRSLNHSPNQSRGQSTNPTQFTDPSISNAIMENPPLPSSVFLPSERQESLPEDTPSSIPEPAQPPSHASLSASDHRSLPSPKASLLSDLGITSRPASIQQQAVQSPNSNQLREANEFSPGRISTTSAPRIVDIQPSSIRDEVQSYPSPSTPAASNPHKRQRTQIPVMPPLKNRVALINKHIDSVGGMMNLNTGLERPRFQLLTEACRTEDSFYVALHQIFCVWDTNMQEVTDIVGFPNVNILSSAFKILGQLIRDNEQLAPNHKIWFSKFPSPLGDLLRNSEPYRNTVADVGNFLGRLANDWAPLSLECTNRGYPPLVDELVNRWGLLSPTLQSVVFTATRRNLGIRDEEVGSRMEDLFRRDRREHQALAARYNTARPPTAKELRERNNALVTEYLTLHNHLLQRRSSGAMVGSPLMRGPTPVLPSNAPVGNGNTPNVALSRPQSGVNPAVWHQNMPSPDPTGNWQFGNQHQQGPARVSNSSPNPSIITGRPPSVGAHRVHPNTPSPTLLQGLSMQSPVQQGFQFAPAARNNTQVPSNPNIQLAYTGTGANRTLDQPPVDSSVQQRAQIALQQQQIQQQQISQQLHQQQFAQLQQQQQLAAQHQQHIASQQHFPPQQYQQGPQNLWHQSSFQSPQQQALMRQQQQMQMQLEQQAHNPNRAAQLRHDSNGAVDPQRPHARHNSISSNGRRTPTANLAGRPSPRIGGPPVSTPGRVMTDDIHTYSLKPLLHRTFIPPLGYIHPPQPAIPDIVAIHQAHLRSPRLVAADSPPYNTPLDDKALRYYQSVRGFALPPTRISMNTPLSKFDFRIPEAQLALIPEDIFHSNGQLTTREFRRGTIQYRLRCIQTKRTDTRCSITDWVLKDTVWPESASLSINKKHLELRRKNHHGKDLPVDITPFVRLAGSDTSIQISLSIIKGRTKMKEFSYFIAVEVVEILQHGQILEMCGNNRISANISLDKIKRSLAGPADDGDDDIAMVVSDLSIDLADPFTARIYDIPVRGSSCLHRECFDLETFLLTRNSKPKRQGQPCMVDVWKCPLCGKDARPYSLQIDDFLVSIRESLEAQGNLDVKAIWIGADGNWRPKVEKRKAPPDPNDSDYSDEEVERKQSNVANRTNPTNQPKSNRVVIDLDDD